MSQTAAPITLRVAEGRRVRMPDGKPLTEGEDLQLEPSTFVLRRMRDGDLVPPPEAPKRASNKGT